MTEQGRTSCGDCKHKGNACEMVGNRIMIYCDVVGGMVFEHDDELCFVWEVVSS
jgi:hypothetical protein